MIDALSKSPRHVAYDRITELMLSPELNEALMRATLATAENHKRETGFAEFFCALYLHFGESLQRHFQGDLNALLLEVFPKHRTGRYGLFPEAAFESRATCETPGSDRSATAIGWQVNCGDELLRLLWSGGRISCAVGKRTSLMDIVAAIGLTPELLAELHRKGIHLRGFLGDLDAELGSIIFRWGTFADRDWPSEQRFDVDAQFLPPFTLELKNPISRFKKVIEGKVILNGHEIAKVSDSEQTITMPVQLQQNNTISVVLSESDFAGIEIIIRGNPRR